MAGEAFQQGPCSAFSSHFGLEVGCLDLRKKANLPFFRSGGRYYAIARRLRRSGIGAVGDVPWGRHVCLLYEQPTDLLDLLTPYCAAGLEDHEYCLVVTSEPLPWQPFLDRMSKQMPGFTAHVQQGDIAIVSHTAGISRRAPLTRMH